MRTERDGSWATVIVAMLLAAAAVAVVVCLGGCRFMEVFGGGLETALGNVDSVNTDPTSRLDLIVTAIGYDANRGRVLMYFGNSAQFWLNLQMTWDLWHAHQHLKRLRVV